MDTQIFSSIAALDWLDLTEAIYQVLQILKEGLNSPLAMSASSQREIPIPAMSGSGSNLRSVVEGALREISDAEGKPLREIPESDLDQYKQRLYELLASRTKQELVGSNLSGAQLLSQLR